MIDRLDCYELCVQSPRHVVGMLRGIHGGAARVLREDFCGTAGVCRQWAREGLTRGDGARAVGVDLDGEVLQRGTERAREAGVLEKVRLVQEDAASGGVLADDGADIIFVGNFSIGYIHTRAALVEYLRRSRERLVQGTAGAGPGVFVCDLYGGASAWRRGSLERTHLGRGSQVVTYHWEHESADPITGMVENSISLRVVEDGELVAEMPRAFVYRWRLWGLAELREAMLEAGFGGVGVYEHLTDGSGEEAMVEAGELGEDWVVMVGGRNR